MIKLRSIIPLLIPPLLTPAVRAGIRVDFGRNNQTYDWLTTVDYDIRRGGFNFSSSFNGQSNLVKGPSNRWQENALGQFMAEKSIRPSLSLVTSARYDVSGLDKRRVRSSDLAAGISYRPNEFLELRPLVMAERIRRSQLDGLHNDQGAGYELGATFKPSTAGAVVVSGDLVFHNARISNIPANEMRGGISASARVFESDTLWISLKGTEASKKYYGASGRNNDIVKQIKQEREAGFGASMAFPANFQLRVEGDAHLSRYLYRYGLGQESTAPQRDNFGRGGGYRVTIINASEKSGRAIVGYAWNRASQDFQGLLLDQDAELGEMTFQGTINLSPRDSLAGDAVFGVTSYSNPDSNLFDRDQKTIVLNGRYEHVFSHYFAIGVSGGVNSFHQIYISSAQSGNNGRNDTYILTPFARWLPWQRLTVKQLFDIQANYITFDFDRKQLATKNRIFRRATTQTELNLELSRRLTWRQIMMYRYEDYGQLIWSDGWQQAVSWDRRKGGLETRITYNPTATLRFSPVFAWEKTGDYSHTVVADAATQEPQEIRYLSDEQVKVQYGFEFSLNWDARRSFKAEFNHRVRRFQGRPREVNDFAAVTLEYLF
jgi:hypothetical protein